MSIKLYLAYFNVEPIMENTYYDDQGNTVYKVHTPFGFNRTTTITKAIYGDPNDPPHPPPLPTPFVEAPDNEEDDGIVDDSAISESSKRSRTGADAEDELQPSSPSPLPIPPIPPRRNTGDRTNFIYVAQIEWRRFKSTKVRFAMGRYSGKEVLVKDLFRKQGWGNRGHSRVFTGEDGKEYKWVLARFRSELTLNDSSQSPIATYHPKNVFK
ncbi:hypothetical protein D9757_005163, partial [Collybiopsis confluens]